MTSDCDFAELLRPLRALDFMVGCKCYPNTYPMGFHYATACKDLNDAQSRVRIFEWEQNPEIRLDKPFLFYCTPQQFSDLALNSGNLNLYKETVSHWLIRHIYVKRSALLKSLRVSADVSMLDLETARRVFDAASDVEVYSDIGQQAAAVVEEFLRPQLADGKRVLKRFDKSCFAGIPLVADNHSLLVFVTSAPFSKLMDEEREHFVAIACPDSAFSAPAMWDLVAAWYLPERYDTTDNVHLIRSAVQCYHASLYEMARQNNAGAFDSVHKSFQALQRNIFVCDIIRTPAEFAKCVSDHHAY